MQIRIKSLAHERYVPTYFSERDTLEFCENPACPTCSATDFKPALALGESHWASKVEIRVCKVCSHIYYSKYPSLKWIEEYYKSRWMQNENASRNTYKQKPKLCHVVDDIGALPQIRSILDFGCGLGANLASFRESGIEDLTGIEVSRHRWGTSNARFPGRILFGHYTSLNLNREFDLIYADHVIEHLPDPFDALNWMRNRLAPSGLVVIAVPNSEAESIFDQTFFIPHLHSFSSKSLSKLGERLAMPVRRWAGSRRHMEHVCLFFGPLAAPRLNQERLELLEQRGDLTPDLQVQRLRAPWLSAKKQQASYLHFLSNKQCSHVEWPNETYVLIGGSEYRKLRGLAWLIKYLRKVPFAEAFIYWLSRRKFGEQQIVSKFNTIEFAISDDEKDAAPLLAWLNKGGFFLVK